MTTTPTTAHDSRHTPGPWTIQREFDNEPIYIVAPHSQETVAIVERHNEGDPSSDMPNARLIAAAPELLDALKDLLTILPYYEHKDRAKVEAVRQAIAKAEGRT